MPLADNRDLGGAYYGQAAKHGGRAYRDTTICHRPRRRVWLIKRRDLNAAHIARMAMERDQLLQFPFTGFQYPT